MRFGFFIYILTFINSVYATDLKPWFPRYLEIQSRFTWSHQYYSSIDGGSKIYKKTAKNDFYTGSLELAYFNLCGEVEGTFSSTGSHHLAPDSINATLRYQILDDVIGDPVSLVAGITVNQVFSLALKDINVFHHSHFEGEVHLAVGKEVTCHDTWITRYWGVAGIGVGDQGSPWLHFEAAWEKNWFYGQITRVFANSLFGLGKENLSLYHPFKGYGSIRHQSIDLGALHRYTFENDLEITLGAFFRVYSKNCPRNVSGFFLSLLYPFGL